VFTRDLKRPAPSNFERTEATSLERVDYLANTFAKFLDNFDAFKKEVVAVAVSAINATFESHVESMETFANNLNAALIARLSAHEKVISEVQTEFMDQYVQITGRVAKLEVRLELQEAEIAELRNKIGPQAVYVPSTVTSNTIESYAPYHDADGNRLSGFRAPCPKVT